MFKWIKTKIEEKRKQKEFFEIERQKRIQKMNISDEELYSIINRKKRKDALFNEAVDNNICPNCGNTGLIIVQHEREIGTNICCAKCGFTDWL